MNTALNKNITYNKKTEGSGSEDTILRNRICVYSFLLTILVIWIHSPSLAALDFSELMNGNNMLLYSIQAAILKIAGAAVPGFFLLSGYQFFRDLKAERLSHIADSRDCCGIRSKEVRIAYGIISSKIMRRVKTLLLPYLLWNLIYFAMNIVAKGESLNLGNIFEAVVYYKYNPVFWYMHQLIRISIFTPLLYPLIRCKKTAVPVLIIFFIAAVKYNVLPFHFANEDAVFYYVTGALIALHWDFFDYTETENIADSRRKQFSAVFINLVISVILFFASDIAFENSILFFDPYDLMIMLLILFRVFTAILIMNVIRLIDLREFRPKDIFKISFFVYAVHPVEIKLVKIIQSMFGYEMNGTVIFVLFILMPVICYAVSYLIYVFMKKYMNNVYLMLSGGR